MWLQVGTHNIHYALAAATPFSPPNVSQYIGNHIQIKEHAYFHTEHAIIMQNNHTCISNEVLDQLTWKLTDWSFWYSKLWSQNFHVHSGGNHFGNRRKWSCDSRKVTKDTFTRLELIEWELWRPAAEWYLYSTYNNSSVSCNTLYHKNTENLTNTPLVTIVQGPVF